MGCPLPRVLGTLSSSTLLKFSNINSQLAELLYLDVSPANFTNFGAAWTEVDSGSNVNVDGSGVLTLVGNDSYAANGMIGPALTLAEGYIEYLASTPSSIVISLMAMFNSAAALNSTFTSIPCGSSFQSLIAYGYRKGFLMGQGTIGASIFYTIRLYVMKSTDAVSYKRFKITITGGVFTTETILGQYEEMDVAWTNPFYMTFQRFTAAGGATSVKLPKWYSGYSTAAPYVRHTHDAGEGKVFNNLDFTNFAMPGTVPTTNLTAKYYFGDSATPSMSAAKTLGGGVGSLQAVGKINENHRYIVLDIIANSDGATQVYVDKPNSDTATDGVGDWADSANVRDNDTNQGVIGELSSNKILKSNAIPGNWNDDNMSDNNIYAGLPFGLSETGTLAYITGTDKPRLLAAGGETVYIYGAGFTGKTGAKMGGVSGTPVTGFVVDSNSTAHFTSPSMVNGNYSLYVYGGAYGGIVQDKLFEYDDKLYSAAEEIARNTDPTEAKVVLDTEYKILGDDKLGALESVPAPAKPVITTRVWGTGKVRIDWTPCANAEEYAVERDGVPIISGLTDTCFYLDEDLPAAEYSYVVIAHNATGDTESDPSVISAMLTESEAAIWEAVVSCIGLNAGLAAVITSYWYSRINVDAPTACPLLIAYPFIGNPQGTHLELTVMFKLRVDGDDSDPEVAEVLLAQYMVLLRDAIATIPELENWLDVDISPDENVAFDIPDEDESVIEAFVEAKVSIVA